MAAGWSIGSDNPAAELASADRPWDDSDGEDAAEPLSASKSITVSGTGSVDPDGLVEFDRWAMTDSTNANPPPNTAMTSNEMVNADTDDMLLPPQPARPHRRYRWGWITFAGVIVLGLLSTAVAFSPIGQNLIERPYCAFSPGSARETERAITVVDGPMHPSEGEIFFTTVSVKSLSIWEEFWARRDSTVEVVDEDVGNCNNKAAAEQNQIQMDTSKNDALLVAFQALGIEPEPVGVQIVSVSLEAQSAEVLGLGEMIIGVNGNPVLSPAELTENVSSAGVGDEVVLTVRGLDGVESDRTVVLGRNDCSDQGDQCDPDRPVIGILVQQGVELPYEIDIDSGRVGGPSAGLAFTLAVIDYITEGELTGGQDVAVTGTIRRDGTIGRVGGVPQKTHAARRQGVDIFIVPPDDFESALAVAGDDLIIEQAATLEEALAVLAELGGEPAELALGETAN